MQKVFNQKKRFLNLLLTGAMALSMAPENVFSDSQSGTALVVHVQPEAAVSAAPGASWNPAGELLSLPITFLVKIRLNSGTVGELGISLSEPAGPGIASLEVETEAGLQEITATPITFRSYSTSGAYDEMVLIQRPISNETDSLPTSVTLRLTSSDSAIAESQIIILPAAQ